MRGPALDASTAAEIGILLSAKISSWLDEIEGETQSDNFVAGAKVAFISFQTTIAEAEKILHAGTKKSVVPRLQDFYRETISHIKTVRRKPYNDFKRLQGIWWRFVDFVIPRACSYIALPNKLGTEKINEYKLIVSELEEWIRTVAAREQLSREKKS